MFLALEIQSAYAPWGLLLHNLKTSRSLFLEQIEAYVQSDELALTWTWRNSTLSAQNMKNPARLAPC